MNLSIIILNYQTKGLLREGLKGILAFDLDLEYEIIVVDNNSGDGSVEMVQEKFPQVKLITSARNLGHAAGNNLGIQAASGQYLLLINTDIVFLKNIFRELYDFMQNHPEAAACAPQLINPDGSIQNSCFRFYNLMTPLYRRTFLGKTVLGQKDLARFSLQDFDRQSSRAIDWAISSCLMVRYDLITKLGSMDERFFMYFADVDWCRRFQQAGYKVYYYPAGQAIHYYHRHSAQQFGLKSIFSKETRVHIIDWLRYLKKYQKCSKLSFLKTWFGQ